MEDRRAFLKKVSCITGACLCGFTSLVQTATASENGTAPVPNPNESLMQDWISNLLLCYCSEGFAELMFSKVVGHPVKAEVIRSIHRGAASCAYQIDINV